MARPEISPMPPTLCRRHVQACEAPEKVLSTVYRPRRCVSTPRHGRRDVYRACAPWGHATLTMLKHAHAPHTQTRRWGRTATRTTPTSRRCTSTRTAATATGATPPGLRARVSTYHWVGLLPGRVRKGWPNHPRRCPCTPTSRRPPPSPAVDSDPPAAPAKRARTGTVDGAGGGGTKPPPSQPPMVPGDGRHPWAR
jgi:hypothetical protein